MAPSKPRTVSGDNVTDQRAEERADTMRSLVWVMHDAHRSGLVFEELLGEGKRRFEQYLTGQLEFDPQRSRYEPKDEIASALVSLMDDARGSNLDFDELLGDAARHFENEVIDTEEMDQRF